MELETLCQISAQCKTFHDTDLLTPRCIALQEAQAIFGDADELLEQFRAATARSGQQQQASDEEDDEGLDEADLAADEDAQAERLRTAVCSCIPAPAISLPPFLLVSLGFQRRTTQHPAQDTLGALSSRSPCEIAYLQHALV